MLAIDNPFNLLTRAEGSRVLPSPDVEWITADHPARSEVEAFVREVFDHTYGATVSHFAQLLLARRDAHGKWLAALGVTPLASRAAWLECYLDHPVEEVLSQRLGRSVARHEIAEVGNLSARSAGAMRALIALATRHLAAQGIPWVSFTATRGLLNAIRRLDISVRELAPADPLRLPDQGASWGSYYTTHPMVMAGHIPAAMKKLDV